MDQRGRNGKFAAGVENRFVHGAAGGAVLQRGDSLKRRPELLCPQEPDEMLLVDLANGWQ